MSRLIAADALIEELRRPLGLLADCEKCPVGCCLPTNCQDCIIEDVIKKMPAIDPVKHGKWEINLIEDDEGFVFGKSMLCSECGFFWREALHNKFFKHCPNCGAKMDGEFK